MKNIKYNFIESSNRALEDKEKARKHSQTNIESFNETDFLFSSKKFAEYKSKRLRELLKMLLSPVLIFFLAYYLSRSNLSNKERLTIWVMGFFAIGYLLYLMREFFITLSSKCPKSVLYDGYLIVPFKKIKISILNTKTIKLCGEDIKIEYLSSDLKVLASASFPASILSNVENFLKTDIAIRINSQTSKEVQLSSELNVKESPSDGLALPLFGLLGAFIEWAFYLILYLLPVWIFIIAIYLIFK